MKVLILVITVLTVLSGCSKHSMGFKVKPEINGIYDTATYDFIYTEAIKQKLLGNSGDAISLFQKCIEMNPRSDAAYYQIAQIMLSHGDISTGKKFALKAFETDERNIWYLSLLASIYYQEKNLDSALIYY